MIKSQYWSIDRLPGIKRLELELLKQNQIENTKILLELATTPQSRATLANRLQLNQKHVNKWAALADLARLNSVGDWQSLAEGIAIVDCYYTLGLFLLLSLLKLLFIAYTVRLFACR